MRRAYDQFLGSMQRVDELDTLYLHLKNTLHLPNDLTDILRAEVVYVVSALDKFIHELVRIGMAKAFVGTRTQTSKFKTFPISIDTHNNINDPASIAPPSYWFDLEIVEKHNVLSFQHPDKISEALSLIWDEQHKWQVISNAMGLPERDVKTKLKTIVARRNQIVHESDIEMISGNINAIDKADADDIRQFVSLLVDKIFSVI